MKPGQTIKEDLTNDELLLEQLAAFVHGVWMAFAQDLLAKGGACDEERQRRWRTYMVPYDDLPEEIKEYDRIHARKACKILRFFCENLDVACQYRKPVVEE